MSFSARQRKRHLTDALIDADEGGRQNPEEQHTPKRQRVSRACDNCRLKKDKCDGVRPVCSTCASLSRPCTYKSNPKKRGLPTGYLRTLELLWGLVFGKVQGSERTVKALMVAENIPAHLASVGKEAEFSDGLVSAWKNSTVFKEIEKILTMLEQGEDGPEPNRLVQDHVGDKSPQGAEGILSGDILEWHVSEGLSTGGEPARSSVLSPVNTSLNISASGSAVRSATRDCGTQTLSPDDQMGSEKRRAADGLLQHSTDLLGNDCRLQLPSNAWPLLDIYFSYTQCWFPILEKHDILRTAFRYSEEDVLISSSSPESGEHSALWAALALSSFQETSRSSNQEENPSRLYAIAKGLIPSDGVYEIGHVQALLILALIKLGQQQWSTAWILIGQAIRIARLLGLDCPAVQSKNTGDVRSGRSKHIFLGCFVLETLTSVKISRAPSLNKEDLEKVGSSVDEDGLDEWHPWEDQTNLRAGQEGSRGSSRGSSQRGPLRSLSNFNRLVSLVSVLNDLCLLKQNSKQNSTSPAPELELLERQLQLWVRTLPKTSRVDLDLAVPEKLPPPHIFVLEMAYEGVSTSLSLEIAAHGGQRSTYEVPHQRRAIDGVNRLLRLLQAYMEMYTISATSPIFGVILTFPIAFPGSLFDSGLTDKLQALSSQVVSVWTADESVTMIANRMASIEHNPIPESIPNDSATPHLPTLVETDPILNPPPILTDLSGPIHHPTSVQYPSAYNNPSMTLNPFVDIDGYGRQQRPRITADFDALFDELASLDGAEKPDNQPEFMQNLGFVPNSGIPEFYSYSGQADYFLLTQTQQLLPPGDRDATRPTG